MEGTVGNGGFQLILDSDLREASSFLAEAIRGADLIEAAEHAEVLRAFRKIGPNSVMGREYRLGQARGEDMTSDLDQRVEDLDSSWYALPPVDEQLMRYAEQHPAEFAR